MNLFELFSQLGPIGAAVAAAWGIQRLADTVHNSTSDAFRADLTKRLERRLDGIKAPGSHWHDLFIEFYDHIYAAPDGRTLWGVPRPAGFNSIATSLTVVLMIALVVPGGIPMREEIGGRSPIEFVLFFAIIINIPADYLSLWQTRIFLSWFSRGAGVLWHASLLVADIFISLVLFTLGLSVFFWLGLLYEPNEEIGSPAWAPVMAAASTYNMIFKGNFAFFLPYLLSTFFTSVWIWLHLLSELIVRSLGKSPKLVEKLKWVLPISERPINAIAVVLGSVVVIIVILVEIAAWLTTRL